jgi:hypothetical protein
MRNTVNAFLFVASVFGVAFLCNSCNNDNSKIAIHGEEKIDTCNCSTLVSIRSSEDKSWTFGTKRRLGITNTSKPNLIVEMIKEKKNADSTNTGIIISLKINSAVCVDEGSFIDFVFADSTRFALENFYGNNCHGDFSGSFEQKLNDIEGVKNVVDVNKLRSVKISNIRVMTHDGYQDYNLSDIEAANFMRLFDCLYQAK